MTAPTLAGVGDAALLARLHAAAFAEVAERWDEAAIATLLKIPGTGALLAADRTGMAMFRVAVDEAELLTVAVDPAARRHGTASRLLATAAAIAAGWHAQTLFLEVSERNAPALALYQRDGFAPIGRRPRYYADGSDAVVMARPLAPR